MRERYIEQCKRSCLREHVEIYHFVPTKYILTIENLEKTYKECIRNIISEFGLFFKQLLLSSNLNFSEDEFNNHTYLFQQSVLEIQSILERTFTLYIEQEKENIFDNWSYHTIEMSDEYIEKKQNEVYELLQAYYENYLNNFIQDYFTLIFYEEKAEEMKEIERKGKKKSWVRTNQKYLKLGERHFFYMKKKLYKLICHDNHPKNWVNACISGEIRNTIVGIVGAITAKYNTFLGIAVPIAALIANQGVIKFCKSNPS